MKRSNIMTAFICFCAWTISWTASAQNKVFSISTDKLKDKIKGGWAGQTIGVTFGGPTEFRYQGTFIPDYYHFTWYDGYLKKTLTGIPGLYDDIYMDLTFMEVIEKNGIDASAGTFAQAFAKAGYFLDHANQVARNNILRGIDPSVSGYWLNNPHADCIDFQIESDFAGLMSPGMPNAAAQMTDKVGHIMNYGDGWYGGVFVSAMYATAFTSNDIPYIVSQALKTIPAQSKFHKVISDVIRWHAQYPHDWKQTWFQIQRKWTEDIGCPVGVFIPFDIDATVNAAYVVMGLLYGNGDFTRTLEIAARGGQDSDCNPSTAGGVLGAVLGYDKIPAYWKQGLKEAESIRFEHTSMALTDIYATGYKHALQMIIRNGGTVKDDQVRIPLQSPKPVRFEQSFTGHYPVEKRAVNINLNKEKEFSFEFEGIGFVIMGETSRWGELTDFTYKAELYVDDSLIETAALPASFANRRIDLLWKYQLPKQKHRVRVKILNPNDSYVLKLNDIVIYSDGPLPSKDGRLGKK